MTEIDLPGSWRDRALVWSAAALPPLSHWFTEEELSVAQTFKLEKRRNEWLQARIVAKELARRKGLCENPRDFTVTRPLISISHSGPYAAAAINAGIDVEVLRDVSEKAARHFLIESEIAAMEHCTIAHRLLHFWCAKEAAWKARGGAVALLRDVPLVLLEETDRSLRFDGVESYATGDIIMALTATCHVTSTF